MSWERSFWVALEAKVVGRCSVTSRMPVMTFKMPVVKRKGGTPIHLGLHFIRLGVRTHGGPLCVLARVGIGKGEMAGAFSPKKWQ